MESQESLPDLSESTREIAGIDESEVQNLLESMIRGIFNIENGLYSQASFEFGRVSSLRNAIQSIEKDVLSETFLKDLPAKSRLSLYYSLQNSMYRSMDFLQKLHGSVATGIDSVGNLTKTFYDLVQMKKTSLDKQNQPAATKDDAIKTLKEELLGEIKKRAIVNSSKPVDLKQSADEEEITEEEELIPFTTYNFESS